MLQFGKGCLGPDIILLFFDGFSVMLYQQVLHLKAFSW